MSGSGPSSPFAEFLRGELLARKWANTRLAEACGVSPSLVSRWKNGRTVPKAQNCSCIADTFGLDANYVLRLAGHMPAQEPIDHDADAWAEQQRRWSIRFDQGLRSLPRPVDDNCTERTVTAWLDAFVLLVNRLSV